MILVSLENLSEKPPLQAFAKWWEQVTGISACSHFVCLISSRSVQSQHVLNEVDLAFNRMKEGVTIIPMILEDCEMRPSFRYYLARMQHVEGARPPIEARFEDLANRILTKN